MSRFKGVGVLSIKKLFAEKDVGVEESFFESLSSKQQHLLKHLGPSDWILADDAVAICEKAAAALFPGDPNGVRILGKLSAKDNLTGIYKMLLSVTTIAFATKMTALIWERYYDSGKAESKHCSRSNRTELSVRYYPDFPEVLRKAATGYLEGVADLCRQQNAIVTHDDSNPNCWKWEIVCKS